MLDMVIEARRTELGGGLEVGRVLPFRLRRMVGPFIFLDHAGPVDLPANIPRSMDVRPHPHIGLSTLTYLFAGTWMHRDSLGFEQVIHPGDVNWMTAGRGVSHSERFEDQYRRAGGPMELLQAWVALPTEREEAEPSFHHHGQAALPELDGDGRWARLIAGQAFGETSPVEVHSPLFYLHVELAAGARTDLPTGYPERAAYVVRGEVDADGQTYRQGQLLVFREGAEAVLTARTPATVMLLGGDPVGPRHIWWNFVSSSRDRIEQAKADWDARRIPMPVHDEHERIPLPHDAPKPPPEPLS